MIVDSQSGVAEKTISIVQGRPWVALLISVLIVLFSSLFRMAFFGDLGRGIPYLTYYPGVMLAAIIGGLPAGLLATGLSAVLAFSWVQQGQLSYVEWLAMVFFVAVSIMISILAHAMHRANRKALKAEAEAEAANRAKGELMAKMSEELHALVEERTVELRQIQERYELAVAGSEAGLWDWDIASDTIHYSDRLQELLGYEAGEFSNSLDEFWDRLHTDDQDMVRSALDRHLEDRGEFNIDYQLRMKSGDFRWFHARGQALWDDNSEPTRMSGSIIDITERKLAEEELVKSENRFRQLMEQSPLPIVIHSPDGRNTQVNSAWLQLWGLTEQEAAVFFENYNVRSDQQAIDHGLGPLIEEAFAGKAVVLPPIEYDSRNTFDDLDLDKFPGKAVWIQSHMSPVKDENGDVMFVVDTLADITDIKLAEGELVKSEARFRALMEQSPLAIVIFSPDGKITQYNSAWSRMWGVSEEEAAQFIAEYNVRTDQQQIDLGWGPLIEEAFAGNAVVLPPIEYVARQTLDEIGLDHIPGKTVWIQPHLSPVKDENGEVVFVVDIVVDVTSVKQAEEELAKSEGRFRALMEQSPLGMEILSPDGQIVQINTAWRRLWNVTEEEAAETIEKYNMLTDPQLEELGVADLTRKAFEGEPVALPPIQYSAQQTTEDFDLPAMDVRAPWIRSHLYPVKDEGGNVDFVVNTYQDITDLKQAESEARRHQDAIARLDRATSMGQLTGSIAHELNQPLTGILSNAQAAEMMLERGECDFDELAEIMAEIVADTKRGGQVIQNLRELYREQKGEYEPVNINALVDETAVLLNSEFVVQNIVVKKETSPSIPPVDGNRIQIQQVLVNLIMNGVQAMAETPRAERDLLIETSSDETLVKVLVEDRGRGIETEKIDTIFEPLATWKSGGTGMGLAISNSIVEAHGGGMWAENKSEGGARVGFSLPVRNEVEPQ